MAPIAPVWDDRYLSPWGDRTYRSQLGRLGAHLAPRTGTIDALIPDARGFLLLFSFSRLSCAAARHRTAGSPRHATAPRRAPGRASPRRAGPRRPRAASSAGCPRLAPSPSLGIFFTSIFFLLMLKFCYFLWFIQHYFVRRMHTTLICNFINI